MISLRDYNQGKIHVAPRIVLEGDQTRARLYVPLAHMACYSFVEQMQFQQLPSGEKTLFFDPITGQLLNASIADSVRVHLLVLPGGIMNIRIYCPPAVEEETEENEYFVCMSLGGSKYPVQGVWITSFIVFDPVKKTYAPFYNKDKELIVGPTIIENMNLFLHDTDEIGYDNGSVNYIYYNTQTVDYIFDGSACTTVVTEGTSLNLNNVSSTAPWLWEALGGVMVNEYATVKWVPETFYWHPLNTWCQYPWLYCTNENPEHPDSWMMALDDNPDCWGWYTHYERLTIAAHWDYDTHVSAHWDTDGSWGPYNPYAGKFWFQRPPDGLGTLSITHPEEYARLMYMQNGFYFHNALYGYDRWVGENSVQSYGYSFGDTHINQYDSDVTSSINCSCSRNVDLNEYNIVSIIDASIAASGSGKGAAYHIYGNPNVLGMAYSYRLFPRYGDPNKTSYCLWEYDFHINSHFYYHGEFMNTYILFDTVGECKWKIHTPLGSSDWLTSSVNEHDSLHDGHFNIVNNITFRQYIDDNLLTQIYIFAGGYFDMFYDGLGLWGWHISVGVPYEYSVNKAFTCDGSQDETRNLWDAALVPNINRWETVWEPTNCTSAWDDGPIVFAGVDFIENKLKTTLDAKDQKLNSNFTQAVKDMIKFFYETNDFDETKLFNVYTTIELSIRKKRKQRNLDSSIWWGGHSYVVSL